jgi:hypothetical protein
MLRRVRPDGSEVWATRVSEANGHVALVTELHVIVSMPDGSAAAYAFSDGRALWRAANTTPLERFDSTRGLAFDGPPAEARGFLFSLETGERLGDGFSFEGYGPGVWFGAGVAHTAAATMALEEGERAVGVDGGGRLWLLSSDHVLHAEGQPPRCASGLPAIRNGRIYVAGRDGVQLLLGDRWVGISTESNVYPINVSPGRGVIALEVGHGPESIVWMAGPF